MLKLHPKVEQVLTEIQKLLITLLISPHLCLCIYGCHSVIHSFIHSFFHGVTLEFHFEAVTQQHCAFYSHRSFSTAGKSLFSKEPRVAQKANEIRKSIKFNQATGALMVL